MNDTRTNAEPTGVVAMSELSELHAEDFDELLRLRSRNAELTRRLDALTEEHEAWQTLGYTPASDSDAVRAAEKVAWEAHDHATAVLKGEAE
jgi:hypothetical protein